MNEQTSFKYKLEGLSEIPSFMPVQIDRHKYGRKQN